jgi:hypothetical protein
LPPSSSSLIRVFSHRPPSSLPSTAPAPSHYLLLPFSLNRWSLLSDPSLRSGSSTRSKALREAPFVVRVFSAAPLEMREVRWRTVGCGKSDEYITNERLQG